jgi:hypothetical protein
MKFSLEGNEFELNGMDISILVEGNEFELTVDVCPDHSRPPLWCIDFSSCAHWLIYTEYIMCKLSFIHFG